MAIKINIFDQPQNGRRGVVSADFNLKGWGKQVAHAYLINGKQPLATIHIPTSGNMSLTDIRAYAAELIAFADAVEAAQP